MKGSSCVRCCAASNAFFAMISDMNNIRVIYEDTHLDKVRVAIETRQLGRESLVDSGRFVERNLQHDADCHATHEVLEVEAAPSVGKFLEELKQDVEVVMNDRRDVSLEVLWQILVVSKEKKELKESYCSILSL
jgi:hypothetical protein